MLHSVRCSHTRALILLFWLATNALPLGCLQRPVLLLVGLPGAASGERVRPHLPRPLPEPRELRLHHFGGRVRGSSRRVLRRVHQLRTLRLSERVRVHVGRDARGGGGKKEGQTTTFGSREKNSPL